MQIRVKMSNSEEDTPIIPFENPMALSLEKVYLKIRTSNDTIRQVKALDPFWGERQFFPLYLPIPVDQTDETIQEWLKKAQNYINALKAVYKLPFYKFWSYVSYVPNVASMLESFLTDAVSPVLKQPTGHILLSYTQIYDLVFRIYYRICTFKESETVYISRQVVGSLLKDKVITSCVLWDLVRLYGHIDDDGLLAEIMRTSLNVIPMLKDELSVTVNVIADIFETIGTIAYENDAPTERSVNALAVLLHESAFTLHRFLKVYPDFKKMCIAENLFSRIVHIYSSECPIMYKLMQTVLIDENHPAINRVDNARVELLQICQVLTTFCMDMILQTQEDLEEQHKWAETYLGLLHSAFDQNTFVIDFNCLYPIAQDVETLLIICQTVDKIRALTILSCLASFEPISEVHPTLEYDISPVVHTRSDEATLPEDIIMESKIVVILDMLPHLGDGFVEQCLLHLNGDPQAVIMAILEDKLSPQLAALDKTLPRIPAEETPEEELERQTKIAYVGKKPDEHETLAQLLDDKSHIQEQKERFTAYSLVADDMYDDDYDDSFDDCPGIVVERDDMERLPLRMGETVRSDSEEEQFDAEDGRDDLEGLLPPRGDAFCEDPALLRARREAKYLQRQPAKSKDFVGKPKGQGQDKSVLQNREKKNTNKSAKGNHNRRSGAQWKRGRGMIPS